MKRTLLSEIPRKLPECFAKLFRGAPIYDSSCSPEARVYYSERDGGMFLKRGALGSLKKEAQLTRYFHSLGLGAEVLMYENDGYDWLLTRRVAGEDCTHRTSDPKRLALRMGEELRLLHSLPALGCPVTDRCTDYLKTVEEGYKLGRIDLSFAEDAGIKDAQDAIKLVREGACLFKSTALIHGDFCLPNIMMDENMRLTGYIDLGAAGIGDPHIDLFWGCWTLKFNLGTNRYRDLFLDAYGREAVDRDMLKIIGCAEVFG